MSCHYCYNARIHEPSEEELYGLETALTDENDMSSCSIGKWHDGYRMMLDAGDGKPVRITIGIRHKYWSDVGIYYPKFCPECGRKLDEYERRNENAET